MNDFMLYLVVSGVTRIYTLSVSGGKEEAARVATTRYTDPRTAST